MYNPLQAYRTLRANVAASRGRGSVQDRAIRNMSLGLDHDAQRNAVSVMFASLTPWEQRHRVPLGDPSDPRELGR